MNTRHFALGNRYGPTVISDSMSVSDPLFQAIIEVLGTHGGRACADQVAMLVPGSDPDTIAQDMITLEKIGRVRLGPIGCGGPQNICVVEIY